MMIKREREKEEEREMKVGLKRIRKIMLFKRNKEMN